MANGSGYEKQSNTTRVICCASLPGDPVNLLNEQAIQGSVMNKFTDNDQNNKSVRQAMANNPVPSSSTLVSFGRGCHYSPKTGGANPSMIYLLHLVVQFIHLISQL